MGAFERRILVLLEATLRYHSDVASILTSFRESGWGTVSVRQFDWGGRLQKSNGGARRFPQTDWKPVVECKGIRELDCETYKSSRCESRS